MVIEHLKQEFQKRVSKNPSYSIRAFARSLEMDSSSLSGILSGKRKLGLKTTQKILEKMPLSKIEKQNLLFQYVNPESQSQSKQLSSDHLEIVAGWEHFAILSLIETKGFQNSAKYVAQQLNLDLPQAMRALDRLERVGLIINNKGKYKLNQKGVSTSDNVPSIALRNSHRQYIEKALYSLEHHSLEQRDITGVTMAINKSKLAQAKKLIREFRKSLAELLESGSQEEVYRLNIQLFPLKK